MTPRRLLDRRLAGRLLPGCQLLGCDPATSDPATSELPFRQRSATSLGGYWIGGSQGRVLPASELLAGHRRRGRRAVERDQADVEPEAEHARAYQERRQGERCGAAVERGPERSGK